MIEATSHRRDGRGDGTEVNAKGDSGMEKCEGKPDSGNVVEGEPADCRIRSIPVNAGTRLWKVLTGKGGYVAFCDRGQPAEYVGGDKDNAIEVARMFCRHGGGEPNGPRLHRLMEKLAGEVLVPVGPDGKELSHYEHAATLIHTVYNGGFYLVNLPVDGGPHFIASPDAHFCQNPFDADAEREAKERA
jgi:hypothetical protein